jgi:hypothetical protein
MRPDIALGGTFPDYELPDHARVLRRLSELQGDDPMILTLAPDHYCPKEHHDLRTISREIPPGRDLSTPGLREAWDAGDLSPFHGWSERSAATSSAA